MCIRDRAAFDRVVQSEARVGQLAAQAAARCPTHLPASPAADPTATTWESVIVTPWVRVPREVREAASSSPRTRSRERHEDTTAAAAVSSCCVGPRRSASARARGCGERERGRHLHAHAARPREEAPAKDLRRVTPPKCRASCGRSRPQAARLGRCVSPRDRTQPEPPPARFTALACEGASRSIRVNPQPWGRAKRSTHGED